MDSWLGISSPMYLKIEHNGANPILLGGILFFLSRLSLVFRLQILSFQVKDRIRKIDFFKKHSNASFASLCFLPL